ncbi:MAG: hypothetical protein AAF829_06625 [Pseudomonadota bacterium]
MSQTVLVLLILSLPGFAFQQGQSQASRVSQRFEGDILQVLRSVIILSLILAYPAFILTNLIAGGAANLALDAFRNPALQSETSSLVAIFKTACATLAFGFFSGYLVGKIRSWRPETLVSSVAPLAKLQRGLVPPLIEAAVLSTHEVSNEHLVYTGMVDDIQIGPEGRVDFVVLTDPYKSTLHMDQNRPKARKNKVRLAEEIKAPGVRIRGRTSEEIVDRPGPFPVNLHRLAGCIVRAG